MRQVKGITCEGCEGVMCYKKTLDWSFGRKCYGSRLERQDDIRVHNRKHQKNIRKHWRTSDYIIQVQDIRNKEMSETPTGVPRS